jgi:hypothetical protein
MAVGSLSGKHAVVTGGGSGMGRELACQLAAAGCSVAACDWHADAVAETTATAQADSPDGVLVAGHPRDVSDEAQVLRYRDELLAEHATDHVDMVFSNAGAVRDPLRATPMGCGMWSQDLLTTWLTGSGVAGQAFGLRGADFGFLPGDAAAFAAGMQGDLGAVACHPEVGVLDVNGDDFAGAATALTPAAQAQITACADYIGSHR